MLSHRTRWRDGGESRYGKPLGNCDRERRPGPFKLVRYCKGGEKKGMVLGEMGRWLAPFLSMVFYPLGKRSPNPYPKGVFN